MSTSLYFDLHNPEVHLLKAKRVQALDDERKPRFFDPKRRQIGVDVEALNAQLQEKQKEKEIEREMNRKFQVFDEMISREYIEAQKQELLKKQFALQQLNDFRKTEQRKELRREFDLNDPKYLCKSLPMCCGDNDPRIKSKGSLLRFDGEDYDGAKARRNLVKLKQILEDQIEECNNKNTSMKVADEEWVKEALMQSEFNQKCMELEEIGKRQEIKHLETFNVLLAKEIKTKRLFEKKKNNAEVLAHMYNCLTSDLFLESANASASALGKTRKNANYYKGLSETELREIKTVQKKQILEREKSEEDARYMEEYFNFLETVNSNESQKEFDKTNLQKRDEAKRISDINKILAIEQRLRRRESERQIFQNNPTEEFYAQFNKTTK